MEAEEIALAVEAETSDLLRVARNAALKAGAFQLQQFACQAKVIMENRPHDLKLKLDRLSETIVMDTIGAEFPDHSILSEEKGLIRSESNYLWIIDPLDGTVNYYFGLPYFCICVACYYFPAGGGIPQDFSTTAALSQAHPLVGVIYAPMLNRLYCAVNGNGATWNDRKILPAANIRLEDAIVGISFGSDSNTIGTMEVINAILVRRAKKIRILGATGLDLAHVAMGNLGALIQLKVQIWDIAAAVVILKESGCEVYCRPNHDGSWRILAANFGVYQELKEILGDLWK